VNDLLPKSQKVRDIVRFAYEQGAASLLELLEAERNANDIRLAAVSARGDLAAARADFFAARPGVDRNHP
jgi:outer membrane protein TolC